MFAVKHDNATISEHATTHEAWDAMLDLLESDMDKVDETDTETLASYATAIGQAIRHDQDYPGVVAILGPEGPEVYGTIRLS